LYFHPSLHILVTAGNELWASSYSRKKRG
jgi:hypothetical protein